MESHLLVTARIIKAQCFFNNYLPIQEALRLLPYSSQLFFNQVYCVDRLQIWILTLLPAIRLFMCLLIDHVPKAGSASLTMACIVLAGHSGVVDLQIPRAACGFEYLKDHPLFAWFTTNPSGFDS